MDGWMDGWDVRFRSLSPSRIILVPRINYLVSYAQHAYRHLVHIYGQILGAVLASIPILRYVYYPINEYH